MATVVPMRMASTRSPGKGAPGTTPISRRMPSTAESAQAGEADRSLAVASRPSSVRPTTSVKVPPRSIQKVQRLSKGGLRRRSHGLKTTPGKAASSVGRARAGPSVENVTIPQSPPGIWTAS